MFTFGFEIAANPMKKLLLTFAFLLHLVSPLNAGGYQYTIIAEVPCCGPGEEGINGIAWLSLNDNGTVAFSSGVDPSFGFSRAIFKGDGNGLTKIIDNGAEF